MVVKYWAIVSIHVRVRNPESVKDYKAILWHIEVLVTKEELEGLSKGTFAQR
jgi:hypothetical protein